jgi:hypothetical protein
MSEDIICGTIGTTPFAMERHDPNLGKYSSFNGTWEELETLVKENFHNHRQPQYMRNGGIALEIPVPADKFIAGEIHLSEMIEGEKVYGEIAGRFGKDQLRKSIYLKRDEQPQAKQVVIALYQTCGLPEFFQTLNPDDQENWEIVSVNASTSEEQMEMAYDVISHNDFGSKGGSPRVYDDPSHQLEALANSFEYSKNTVSVRKS